MTTSIVLFALICFCVGIVSFGIAIDRWDDDYPNQPRDTITIILSTIGVICFAIVDLCALMIMQRAFVTFVVVVILAISAVARRQLAKSSSSQVLVAIPAVIPGLNKQPLGFEEAAKRAFAIVSPHLPKEVCGYLYVIHSSMPGSYITHVLGSSDRRYILNYAFDDAKTRAEMLDVTIHPRNLTLRSSCDQSGGEHEKLADIGAVRAGMWIISVRFRDANAHKAYRGYQHEATALLIARLAGHLTAEQALEIASISNNQLYRELANQI